MERVALIALAGVLAFANGCGGDDAGRGASEDGTTREEYLEAADATCERVRAENPIDFGSPGGAPAAEAGRSRALIQVGREMLAALRDLQPPDELEEDVDDFLGAMERGTDAFAGLALARSEQDEPQIALLNSRLEAADAELERTAAKIGFKECGPA